MSRAGPRYVEVPAERLLGALEAIRAGVEGKGGRFVKRREGREVVVDLVPPGGRAQATVYTTLAEGAEAVRECGEDAVRLFVSVNMPEGPRPLEEMQKILRTAPKGAEDRVQTFLDRLTEELREAYWRARHVPSCPKCGAAMATRATKAKPARQFHGCIRYPTCDGTRPYAAPPPRPNAPARAPETAAR